MEYHFEAPFPKGSRRIGPDLSRLATLQTHSGLSEVLKIKSKIHLKKVFTNTDIFLRIT